MRLIFLSVVFSLLLLSLSLRSSFAQEELILKEATGSSETVSRNKDIEYTLPYPGLLPDSPLYFLKTARDKMVSFLISDPLKKAEFNLLAADKRLNSAVFLFEKGKEKFSLALSTVSKGENYFEDAIAKAGEAKKKGLDTNDILRRLSDSAYKHQEVIKSFEKTAGEDFKEETAFLRKRTEDFKKRVDSLRAQK